MYGIKYARKELRRQNVDDRQRATTSLNPMAEESIQEHGCSRGDCGLLMKHFHNVPEI
jgi:hypothetical protein